MLEYIVWTISPRLFISYSEQFSIERVNAQEKSRPYRIARVSLGHFSVICWLFNSGWQLLEEFVIFFSVIVWNGNCVLHTAPAVRVIYYD